MKCSDYDLPTARDKIFDRLCIIWADTKKANSKAWQDDIWRKANTLQALALYWNTTTDDARRQEAMSIMKDGYDFYKTFLNSDKGPGVWVDDFGWWYGFFSDLAAYDSKLPAPFDEANLFRESQYCYTRMLVNLDDSGQGGIWNHKGTGGERNTVTNAWMLNVAAGLFYWTGKKQIEYKDTAEWEYLWLPTGKYKSYVPPNGWTLYNPQKLLWWLPGPPDSSRYQYWSGDEGVFLRALLWYIEGVVTDPNVKQRILDSCKNLINAALTPTKDFSDPQGFPDTENVMHESPATDGSNDLATGKGVFMRLVTRCAVHYKYFGDSTFKQTFQTFVDATAQSVWCTRDTTTDDKKENRTAPNWNCPYKNTNCPLGPPGEGDQQRDGDLRPQVWQTAGLDALNAAVQIRIGG